MAERDFFGTSKGKNKVFILEKNDENLFINNKIANIFMQPSIDCTRKIYICHDFLFKFDVDTKSFFPPQGLREIEFYNNMLFEEDKQYFAEPIDWGVIDGTFWVAQKFEKLEYPKDYSEKVDELILRYGITDILNEPIEQSYEGEVAINWALKNGLPFIYDYPIIKLEDRMARIGRLRK